MNKNETQIKEYHKQSLGPVYDSDKISGYKQFLDYAFDNDKILNIAITAPKGAGKSSILQTYLKSREDDGKAIKAMNISVGLFEKENSEVRVEKEGNDGSQKKMGIGNQQVEIKILNQIIHQIDPKKIPESRFHIDREHDLKKSLIRAGLVAMLTACILFLFVFPDLDMSTCNENSKYNICQMLNYLLKDTTSFVVVGTALSIILAVFVVMFFVNYSYKRFPKMSVKDCSIDPVSNEDDTMFNRYLDEILYMISNSGYNAIIFEDLERLNEPTIWEKLREINYILNRRLENKGNYSPIKFVYVTIDSLYKGKDRVKFFDYIIPIVPIVDKSNSLEILTQKTKEYNFPLDQAFLGSITEYIYDMRMIINVFNEVSVYKAQLSNVDLDNNKLFARILYKNMLPKDYEKFQYKEGVVYSILKSIDKIKDEALKSGAYSKDDHEKIMFSEPEKYFRIIHKDFNDEYSKIINTLSEEMKNWNENHKGLIKYLIASSQIAIGENQYESYFYPQNITNEEYDFILKVKQNKETNMSQPLEHFDYIISDIKRYFDSVHVLNFYLVKYILSSAAVYQTQIFGVIQNYKQLSFVEGFISFLENSKNTESREILKKFIVELNDRWDSIFIEIGKRDLPELQKRYAELSLSYCNSETLILMNKNNCLTEFLNNMSGFIGG